MDLVIEQLEKNRHDRHTFDSEVDELNLFLKLHANQNQLRNISRTFVAVSSTETKNPKSIYGYFTLSSAQIHCDDLPSDIRKKIPKHPVPAARIGRLARDIKYKGDGIGEFLLYNALNHILDVSQKIGTYAVVVDAKDSKAKSFYKKYGFLELQDSDLTLFLPVTTIAEAK